MKLLEVIVTSLDEAQAAEDGGAGRLELIRDRESEGLTPSLALAERVIESRKIPVRVMVRENPTFTIRDEQERRSLRQLAYELSQLPIDGLVVGFLKDGAIDELSMREILESAPECPVTFHRAVEATADPQKAIDDLKQFTQVDRVLMSGGPGSWQKRRAFLETLQRSAGPKLRILTGGGLDEESLSLLAPSELLTEFHVGSAARDSSGHVSSALVARLRRILDS